MHNKVGCFFCEVLPTNEVLWVSTGKNSQVAKENEEGFFLTNNIWASPASGE